MSGNVDSMPALPERFVDGGKLMPLSVEWPNRTSPWGGPELVSFSCQTTPTFAPLAASLGLMDSSAVFEILTAIPNVVPPSVESRWWMSFVPPRSSRTTCTLPAPSVAMSGKGLPPGPPVRITGLEKATPLLMEDRYETCAVASLAPDEKIT